MNTTSTSPTIRRLRTELKSALDALASERDRMTMLAKSYETVIGQRDTEVNRGSDLARRLATSEAKLRLSEQALDLSRKHATEVFERHHFEAMTREQLVSFAEGSINEARRKGMVEAEGLLTRHVNLSRQTDLELMRGVVREYQSRIAEVEQEQKTATTGAVKLDTRPLSEKLDITKPTTSPATFKAPAWWEVKPSSFVEARRLANQGFKAFDAKAATITAEAKAKEPHILNDGARVTVPGMTGGHYVLARVGDVYSCSCPAWLYNRVASDRRTCKHLETYLGVENETKRVNRPHVPIHCWCGVELVRGQCQLHTRDWKGSEKCECGRSFAACKAAFDTLSTAQARFGHQPRLGK